MNSLSPLFSARSKVVWANEHIRELQAEWERFLDSDFCELMVQRDSHALGDSIGISMKGVPVKIPLLIGDAIHNLRTGLDHAVNDIIGYKSKRLSFPAHQTREELIASFRTEPEIVDGRTLKKGGNAPVEVAFPGAREFFADTVKAYRGGTDYLWEIGKLDSTDKHRMMTILVIPQTISGVDYITSTNSIVTNATLGATGYGFCSLMGGTGKIHIQNYGKATAEIFFGETDIIEQQPVLPALVQMSNVVTETIDLVEGFARRGGWEPRGVLV